MRTPKLNNKYRTFLKNCKRPTLVRLSVQHYKTNIDHTSELIKHYNLTEEQAEYLREQYVRELFLSIPFTPQND
mgnify:CR=1 FL=1|jgi:hypothetical protein|tara:strand:+ start:474 stop:695 length:222 start_codon:yes stop_codon:yes gene_type:complete